MLLKTLVTSLFSFSILFFSISSAHGQSCEWVEDDKGVIDGFIAIDGEVFRTFEKDKAVEILTKLRIYELQKDELEELKLKTSLLQGVVTEQKFMISILNKNIEADRELLNKALGRSEKWYSNDYVVALTSFAIASLAYGYWSLATK